LEVELKVDGVFREIARAIVSERNTDEEWAELESDDMFQEGPYVGGYDALEEAFTFSYYADDGREYWFQLMLAEIQEVAAGTRTTVDSRPAE
jgi:hypothetical protein